jgi:hypothetical protein
MKTKILLALLFSAFFTHESFAKQFKVIRVVGTVKAVVGTTVTRLTTGKKFNATINPSELLFVTAGSITFAETISGAQPQTASCNSSNCQPKAIFVGNVVVGTHREKLDNFLMNDHVLLSAVLAKAIHNAGLQLIKQTSKVSSNKIDSHKAAPVQSVPQKLPKMNKAVQKQR